MKIKVRMLVDWGRERLPNGGSQVYLKKGETYELDAAYAQKLFRLKKAIPGVFDLPSENAVAKEPAAEKRARTRKKAG